jgi:alkanesulfonate monooxygenase SsuD/methylene tetrahydromethanopterin reductase-like flavin-dependent oxidoreductase (luciferase family)
MSYIGDGGGRPVLDTYIETLAQLRDEGFRRLWSSQLPSEPDLLTLLAVALREVDAIEVGSAVLPLQVQHPSQLAQRALVVNQIAGGLLKLGLGVHHIGVTEEL